MSNFTKGRLGEDLAAEHYMQNGYETLERNWRWSNKGEIDIIAYSKSENIIAVCEVKTRKEASLTAPCEAVNAAKIRKLKILAEVYMLKNKPGCTAAVRFDVAEVTVKADGHTADINILYNAF